MLALGSTAKRWSRASRFRLASTTLVYQVLYPYPRGNHRNTAHGTGKGGGGGEGRRFANGAIPEKWPRPVVQRGDCEARFPLAVFFLWPVAVGELLGS
jgi:hypothetical protein